MTLNTIFIAIAALGVVWYVVSTILIYETLRKKNVKVNFVLLRCLAPRYANQYKEITIHETGHTGMLFYHWTISINAALLMVILLIIRSLI